MIQFTVINTGDENISVRDKNSECVVLKPGEESDTLASYDIVITADNQPYAIAALGAYNGE